MTPSPSAIAQLSGWLEEINRELGTAFSFDADGFSAIQFESGILLYLQIVDPDALVLYAPVLSLEEDPKPAFLLGALALNLFQQSTGRGLLGYDAEQHALVYSERLRTAFSSPLDLARRIDEFPAIWQNLHDSLETLQSHPEGVRTGTGSSPEAAPAPVMEIRA
jgi:hypothetical protein